MENPYTPNGLAFALTTQMKFTGRDSALFSGRVTKRFELPHELDVFLVAVRVLERFLDQDLAQRSLFCLI